MSNDTYRPMTDQQRAELIEAAFNRLTTARALHAANRALQEAQQQATRAAMAHDDAVHRHSTIEEEIARGINRGVRLAAAVAS